MKAGARLIAGIYKNMLLLTDGSYYYRLFYGRVRIKYNTAVRFDPAVPLRAHWSLGLLQGAESISVGFVKLLRAERRQINAVKQIPAAF
jgi:hypothetical protein